MPASLLKTDRNRGQVLHFNISLSKQAFGLHYASVSRIVSESRRVCGVK